MGHDLARQFEAAHAALLLRAVGGGRGALTRMIDDAGADDAEGGAPLYMVQLWREPGLVEVVRIGPPAAAIVAVYYASDGPPGDVDWLHRAGLAELAHGRDGIATACKACDAPAGRRCYPAEVEHRCDECGELAVEGDGPEDAMFCAAHPTATIVSGPAMRGGR